jgi:uncharacterized protein (TIGR02266 family)
MNDNEVAESQPRGRLESTIHRFSSGDSASQRREHPRFAVDLEVHLGSDHNFYAGFAENLSAGGIFVATHKLRPEGETIELTIHLPHTAEPVRGLGEVRWIREYNELSNVPPGMGIRFVELERGSLEAIETFLRQRDPLFFDDE